MHTSKHHTSPWKVIGKHEGTRRTHYHIIYISTAKNWGHNSRLGKAIRAEQHKCSQITCIQCMYEYITTGITRTTLKDILSRSDKDIAKCAAHALGYVPQRQTDNNATSAERRNNLLPIQGAARDATDTGMGERTVIPNEDVFEDELPIRGEPGECEGDINDPGVESGPFANKRKQLF